MVSPKIDIKTMSTRKGSYLKRQGGPGAVLIDDNALACEGFYCERVMISAYKALNFMSLGDRDNARIKLNRAVDRQEGKKKL